MNCLIVTFKLFYLLLQLINVFLQFKLFLIRVSYNGLVFSWHIFVSIYQFLLLNQFFQNLPFSIESFTIMFNNVRSNEIELVLLWDQTTVSLPIKQDIDSKVMAQIENLMNKNDKSKLKNI